MNSGIWASASVILALLLPGMGAIVELTLRGHARRRAGPIALTAAVVTSMAVVLAWCTKSGDAIDMVLLTTRYPLHVSLAIRVGGLEIPFVFNLMGVMVLSLWYAQDYLAKVHNPHLCYGLILLFCQCMLGAVLADDLLLFLAFWEGMLLSSSLLLLRWGEGSQAGRVTLRYFCYTQAGSLLLLLATAWLAAMSGSTCPAAIADYVRHHSIPGLSLIAVAMLFGFGVKMAIAPLHGWLPDAHAIAPMPVTILLAAAMLSMGFYGILRYVLVMLGATCLQGMQAPLMVLALVSQVHGAFMSLASRDIKRIVAYSSVSQMGYILFGLATLSTAGLEGSVLHVIGHGALKACFFMGIGVVMARTGRRQIESLGGLWKQAPRLMMALGLVALAMAGLPPMIAFFSEWRILLAGLASRYPTMGAVAFVSPVLTASYGLALVGKLAFAPAPGGMRIDKAPQSIAASTTAAVGLVVALGLVGGPLSRWISKLLWVAQGALP